MLFDSASSPMLSGVDNDDYKSAVSTRTSADRLRKTAGTAASKKRVIKNGGSNRRSILDFPYPSSSSVVKSSSASPSLGYNSNHNKYRKDGAGEFQCPFDGCSYRYNLRRELNRHKNVHLFAGKDKYRCMNCNSGLCRLDSVKRHMEAKGKAGCLKKGLYQEFKENGELIRVRKCKPSWYEAAAANVAASAVVSGSASSSASAIVLRSL
ncbi:hypothetical protein BGZ99_005767 [Dissophora globulifera]|uniref:C2H2-type domain-containing protein n=1 Tax=Dissophora globulifera TaxID=979702 RepID=A0A9P6RV31_9FUNG|nr:hypothetical protein BGZ99_005767 [Dissophora globulifera]